MSGINLIGTSVQKGLTLELGKPATWQHNRGKKPLRVSVVQAMDGQRTANVTVSIPDDNSITLTAPSGFAAPGVNVFVVWDVPSLDANSLNGAYGTSSPSDGFV